ncbi:1-deoxy-D-xylulose-5-phosphate synthase [Vaginella massiliensis]|uniref:1-deoxy-D-xylulose-5-phosphate synthase n=1 Tax=Vaginella massiliensis TaxID=1816680 RepID=UPI0037511AA5
MLENIQYPKDLRQLSIPEMELLAHELREFILETLSIKPGHLGANLGVVELTIALHHYYQTPADLLVWDVGHQAYPHKILTGRKDAFDTIRQQGGLAGFPERKESEYDTFGVGHSSTSISAILGMARASKLKNENRKHIAVIGDASITSGMAMEALNHLGDTDLDVTIILNDNSIGIDPSMGALKTHFAHLDQQRPNFFEHLGLHFIGTFDGHSFTELLKAFELADKINGPKIIHLKTIKGKGYEKAELDQVKWHAPGKFDKLTGELLSGNKQKTYQDVFGESMIELMQENRAMVAITPAMLTGSNLVQVREKFPDRVFDVGIAEQHSVTFAAGLVTQGIVPYVSIYSTFLQRAYDQVIHDVALQNLAVVFCIDRAGIVGSDGATHHGYFDISFLNSIPNLVVSSPRNETDFRNLLYTAQFTSRPFAIRYPKNAIDLSDKAYSPALMTIGKSETLSFGTQLAICSTGKLSSRILEIIRKNQLSEHIHLIDFAFIKPLDLDVLEQLKSFGYILTYEDGIMNGGFGEAIRKAMAALNYQGNVLTFGYPDSFILHATIEELEQQIGLDDESILLNIRQFLNA